MLTFFAFETISRMINTTRDYEVGLMQRKLHEIEGYLANDWKVTYVDLMWLSPALGFLTLTAGVVELFTLALLYLSKSVRDRGYYTRILAAMLFCDAFFTH